MFSLFIGVRKKQGKKTELSMAARLKALCAKRKFSAAETKKILYMGQADMQAELNCLHEYLLRNF
jgi:hypothetical protein